MNVRVYAALGTFDEISETLRYGLDALVTAGFALPYETIILGAHLLPWDTRPDALRIFYNFEQRESPQLNNSTLHLFRQHEVWDYSESNVAWLREQGVQAKHVPVGYVPELQRIEKVDPYIDVLFYGLVNTRRRRILDDLRAHGLNVREVVNCFGQERDRLIARSKIVLNMHYYETGIFEIVRCSYLFANEVCVVSEASVDVPSGLGGALPFVPYDQLVDTCIRLARDTNSATDWAAKSHKAFCTFDEAAILRRAIDGTHSR